MWHAPQYEKIPSIQLSCQQLCLTFRCGLWTQTWTVDTPHPHLSSQPFSQLPLAPGGMLPWRGRGLYLQPAIPPFSSLGLWRGAVQSAMLHTQRHRYAGEVLGQSRGPALWVFPLDLSQLWDWPTGRRALWLLDLEGLQWGESPQPFTAHFLVCVNSGPASQETQVGIFFSERVSLNHFTVLKHDGSSVPVLPGLTPPAEDHSIKCGDSAGN